jgi:DNA primase
VVVEGYMDVIALHQAGFGGAVAPLGTALTAEQMEVLWRMSPAPILCFDGDAAGARAAARAAELCLPMLTPDHSLRFAMLPAGRDPDDLIRASGPAAMQAVLDAARPLVDTLFDVLREGGGETPEARAALRTRLDAAAARIEDKGLAAEYRTALRDRFFASRLTPRQRKDGVRKAPPPRAARVPPAPDSVQNERARCLTAILLRHPVLLHDIEEAYGGLDLPPPLARLRDAILHIEHVETLDSEGLVAQLHASGLGEDAALVLSAAMPLPASARPDAMPAEAEGEWWHLFGLMRGLLRLDEEVEQAARAYAEQQTEAAQRRLVGLVNARLELVAVDPD